MKASIIFLILALFSISIYSYSIDSFTKEELSRFLEKELLIHNPYPSLKPSQFRSFVKTLVDEIPTYPLGGLSISNGAFPCELGDEFRSSDVPTDVRKLKPGDIDVVMAIGDSITAAFGADSGSIFTIFTEYRGISWSVGGDTDYNKLVSIPNILKHFNPNLKGFSIKTGKQTTSNANLNQAVTGGVSSDLLAQVQALKSRLLDGESKGEWNMNESWKMLTIFIGGNDLCEICKDREKFSVDNYVKGIATALDYVKANIPRVFVNLVTPVDVTELQVLSTGLCSLLHPFECACAVGSSSNREYTSQMSKNYTNALYDLVKNDKYSTSDFSVSVQPFFVDTHIPVKDGVPDSSYFAPDCFHFSRKAHQSAAVALWNSMMYPAESKPTRWYPGETIQCPTPDTYLQ